MHTAFTILLKSKKPLPVPVIAQAIAKMVMRTKTILIAFRMTPFFTQSRSFINLWFVLFSKSKSFNPRRKLLMSDVAFEDLSIHQLCSFAARCKPLVRLANVASAGGCKRDYRLAGQVIALKERIDDRRRNVPPDQEAHKFLYISSERITTGPSLLSC